MIRIEQRETRNLHFIKKHDNEKLLLCVEVRGEYLLIVTLYYVQCTYYGTSAWEDASVDKKIATERIRQFTLTSPKF
jgi:hypothetical protein